MTDGHKQFQLLWTLPSFTRQNLFSAVQVRIGRGRVQMVGTETFVRCPLSVKISEVMEQEKANRIYLDACESVRPAKRAELLERKQPITDMRGF